ncbi:Apoptosis-stimulating of p53 protein 2, partial [Dissostichus eleginoides]
MFLTVYLSNNDQHFNEVPITPETLCRDVVELCKEPGEGECYLAEMWRGSEHIVGDGERMFEVLQKCGQQRGEVRYLLRHQRAPGRESGGSRAADQMMKRNQVKASVERCLENGISAPRLDMTLSDLQDLATHSSCRLMPSSSCWPPNEQKRLSNSKLVEEIEQMTGLFQQKQVELMVAVSRVEELSDQLDTLRKLQMRNKLNVDQSGRLQQQRDSLNKRNLEVAAMDRRLAELRQRLWKKKAALQQKENLPVPSDGGAPQHAVGSRVAAVGPYIQSSSSGSHGPPVPARHEGLMKPAYPDGTATLPMPASSLKPPPRPLKPASGFGSSKVTKPPDWSASLSESSGGYSSSTLPRMSSLSCHHSGGKILTDQRSLSGSDIPPPVPSRTNHITENLLRDNQASGKGLSKMAAPPPIPIKPKPFSTSGPPTFSKPPYSTGTFPGKVRGGGGHLSSHSNTLPLPNKHEVAAVRPYTPDPSEALAPPLQKPQTLAASYIYSMYTTQGKGYQPGGGTLPRSQPRVYGKPVLPANGGQQFPPSDIMNSGLCFPDGGETDISYEVVVADVGLLPFLSNPHRNPSGLHHAPRPLKKRSSITEPEGPAGPNIQKLLYQKTTLAAMETIPMETMGPGGLLVQPHEDGVEFMSKFDDDNQLESPEESLTPPPLPPRSPITPPEDREEEEEVCRASSVHKEFPPYPPPPYPTCVEADQGEDVTNMKPPEVTGQVPSPPGKRTILRKPGSERIDHSMRVKFNPLALLLDASLEGEYDLVQRVIYDVEDPSMPNDEGITALHNAVCAGHTEIVKFLVQFGVNANAADSDGWTPLHCAASCNNVQVCKFLVESGTAVFATTYSDMQTAADKCEEMEDGYAQCSQFLY